jgi:hypothetical protein
VVTEVSTGSWGTELYYSCAEAAAHTRSLQQVLDSICCVLTQYRLACSTLQWRCEQQTCMTHVRLQLRESCVLLGPPCWASLGPTQVYCSVFVLK